MNCNPDDAMLCEGLYRTNLVVSKDRKHARDTYIVDDENNLGSLLSMGREESPANSKALEGSDDVRAKFG